LGGAGHRIYFHKEAERTARLTVEELIQIYESKRDEIKARLEEFAEVGRVGSDEKLFEELAFCIFTAGASARMGLHSIEAVRPVLMTGSMRDIQDALSRAHRWAQARGAFAYQTREYLKQYCGMKLRQLLASFDTPDERRDFFAANPQIRGIGYKEASHFLRNIGYRGYAILDKHVLARLAEFKVIEAQKPPSTKKRYLEIEDRMRNFAKRIRIDFDELDLLLWYTKTGEILK
jgi:N-glycosylase/DNA lyase